MMATMVQVDGPRSGDPEQFTSFVKWYRERPTLLAFAGSIVLHALLVALVPGLQSDVVQPEKVLTVRIEKVEPAMQMPSQMPSQISIARQPVVQPLLPRQPEFAPVTPPPRTIEPTVPRTRQVIAQQPLPVIRQPAQVEQVARAELAPPLARAEVRPPPMLVTRPDVTPDRPVIPIVEARPEVELARPDQPMTEIREQARVLPRVSEAPPSQPRPDAVRPAQITRVKVAVPDMPKSPTSAPVARGAPTPVVPAAPVAVAPTRPRPQVTTPTIAAPTSPAPAAPVVISAAPARPRPAAAAPSTVTASALPPVVEAPAKPHPGLSDSAIVAPAPKPERVESAMLEAYRQSISVQVMRHMQYPRVAVARKWEGKTIVQIQLSSNGEVTQVSVSKESGYKALDDAAIRMVKRSFPLPKPPRGVRTVTVPVVFKIQS